MKLDELFPSKYLKASDLDGDTTLTIEGVTTESMKTKDGKEEEKPVLLFAESKPMVMNVTNARAIATLYGDDTDTWGGKQITLYTAEVSAFGETTAAIRVRDAKAMQRKAGKSAPVASGNGADLNLSGAKAKWNTAAKEAKAAGFAALVDQYRPKPDADMAAIVAATDGLRKHLEAETQAEPDFA